MLTAEICAGLWTGGIEINLSLPSGQWGQVARRYTRTHACARTVGSATPLCLQRFACSKIYKSPCFMWILELSRHSLFECLFVSGAPRSHDLGDYVTDYADDQGPYTPPVCAYARSFYRGPSTMLFWSFVLPKGRAKQTRYNNVRKTPVVPVRIMMLVCVV